MYVLHKTVVVALHELKFYKNDKKEKYQNISNMSFWQCNDEKNQRLRLCTCVHTHTSTMCWSLCQYSSEFFLLTLVFTNWFLYSLQILGFGLIKEESIRSRGTFARTVGKHSHGDRHLKCTKRNANGWNNSFQVNIWTLNKT